MEMKKYKSLYEDSLYTKEMEDFFHNRTNKHVKLVGKYLEKILLSPIANELEKSILLLEIAEHDRSKYLEPEYEPYICVTWDYRCKDRGIKYNPPENIKEQMHQATHHHVKNNKHHPEYWSDTNIDLINREDRDEPSGSGIIEAIKMPEEFIACMCADWAAMSKEKGTNSPQEWAKKNVNIRWKFNKDQEDFIYKILDEIWK